jgi:hypothetical protein
MWLGSEVSDVGTSMKDSGVVLTLVLMDTYITLMIWIGPLCTLMRLSLTKLENIELTIITILHMLFPLRLLLLVRPGGYIVTLCVFYFYKFIGKLTFFFQLQQLKSNIKE